MRDIPGFVESRAAILAMKPGHKGHWISFAIAHHLNGDHALAAQALKTYQGIQVRQGCLHSRCLQPSRLWPAPLHAAGDGAPAPAIGPSAVLTTGCRVLYCGSRML